MTIDYRSLISQTQSQVEISSGGKNQLISIDNKFHLPALMDIKSRDNKAKITFASDYAICCGGFTTNNSSYNQNRICYYPVQRYHIFKNTEKYGRLVRLVNNFGNDAFTWEPIDKNHYSIVSSASINLEMLMDKFGSLNKIMKTDVDEIDNVYNYIELGQFPSTYVGDELNKKLESFYKSNALVATGKTYMGYISNSSGMAVKNEEFLYNKQLYVRAKTNFESRELSNSGRHLSNGKEILNEDDKKYLWVKVEPIRWIILNLDNALKAIQSNKIKNFKLKVQSQYGLIAGIPFVTEFSDSEKFWQDGLIMSYLNGIDENKETQQNMPNNNSQLNYFFGSNNFLSEAFVVRTEKEIEDLSKNSLAQDQNSLGKSSAEIYRDLLIKKALEQKKKNAIKNDDTNKDDNTPIK